MNKTREQIIHSMCGTWRHDYGLMDEQSKNSLFRSMAQIFDNDISSELMMQSDCDNYEEELECMRDKIEELELQISTLKHNYEAQEIAIKDLKEELDERISESNMYCKEAMAQPKTCDGCKYEIGGYVNCKYCSRNKALKDYYEPKQPTKDKQ